MLPSRSIICLLYSYRSIFEIIFVKGIHWDLRASHERFRVRGSFQESGRILGLSQPRVSHSILDHGVVKSPRSRSYADARMLTLLYSYVSRAQIRLASSAHSLCLRVTVQCSHWHQWTAEGHISIWRLGDLPKSSCRRAHRSCHYQ